MSDHFGHKHHMFLPEDVIQHLLLGVMIWFWFHVFIPRTIFLPTYHCHPFDHSIPHHFPSLLLSFQSSRTLELALHLEAKVIALKQDALQLMNVDLVGTTCGQLLSVMEFAFGYPESQESKDWAKTGVSCHQYTSQEESEGQSIYRCKLLKPDSTECCTYYASQLVAMCTHIHWKHLGMCIKCHLCDKKSFSSTTMSMHLCSAHSNAQNNWFKLVPTLEGDMIEVTCELLARDQGG